jgi:Zn-dependent M28 family amino/carboxypeptidase
MRRSKLLSLWLTCLLLVVTYAPAAFAQTQAAHASVAPLPKAEVKAADRITAEVLSERLHYVASDEMQGRDTPSKGLDDTAKYIADNLKRWGIKPAGDDGTYFQRIPLKRMKVDTTQTNAALGAQQFKLGTDFVVANQSGTAEGSLVYVGTGWYIRAQNINPYAGIDVRDKIIIANLSFPGGARQADTTGKLGEDWADPQTYARLHGARGLVLIPSSRDTTGWLARQQRSLERGSFTVENPDEQQQAAQQTQQLPTIYAAPAMLDALFAGEQQTAADALRLAQDRKGGPSFTLAPQKVLHFSVSVQTDRQFTQNVVGVLEGKDKQLKQEYVALGAHYDHVGVGAPDKNGDTIYNGADDDGSGTVSVLTMAEAFAKGPRPARSLLFVWHCGEEKGLWGSKYFTEHPTVPLNQIVAQLNIDMIGRSKKEGDTNPLNRELSGPNEIYVIGSQMMSSQLGALSEHVNQAYLNVSFNFKYDDPHDPNRFFFRSDHFNYAQKGVPIIFYFDGVHEDYHRPSDSADKIDYDKMQRVARTIFITAEELANAPARPVVDRQLPKELTER